MFPEDRGAFPRPPWCPVGDDSFSPLSRHPDLWLALTQGRSGVPRSCLSTTQVDPTSSFPNASGRDRGKRPPMVSGNKRARCQRRHVRPPYHLSFTCGSVDGMHPLHSSLPTCRAVNKALQPIPCRYHLTSQRYGGTGSSRAPRSTHCPSLLVEKKENQILRTNIGCPWPPPDA